MKVKYKVMRVTDPTELKKEIPICIYSYDDYESAEKFITRVLERLVGKPEVEYHIRKVWTNTA